MFQRPRRRSYTRRRRPPDGCAEVRGEAAEGGGRQLCWTAGAWRERGNGREEFLFGAGWTDGEKYEPLFDLGVAHIVILMKIKGNKKRDQQEALFSLLLGIDIDIDI
jgi:hypothetical protein